MTITITGAVTVDGVRAPLTVEVELPADLPASRIASNLSYIKAVYAPKAS